jgi:hypothetical protein
METEPNKTSSKELLRISGSKWKYFYVGVRLIRLNFIFTNYVKLIPLNVDIIHHYDIYSCMVDLMSKF